MSRAKISRWRLGGRSGVRGTDERPKKVRRSREGSFARPAESIRQGGGWRAGDRHGSVRTSPDFRAARIAPHSHRLSLATKRPRGSGEAGPAGPWPAAARGQRNHPASSNTKAGGLVPRRRGRKKKPRRGVNRAGFPRAMTAASCSPPALRAQLTEVLQKTEHPNEKEPAGGGLFRCASRGRRGQSQTCSRRMTGLPQAS